DIAHYHIYLSTDASDVLTKTTVDSKITQPSSGDNATAVIEGLSNGTSYFIAMEATDSAGNVSATRTSSLTGGGTATATPQLTGGPIAFLGEAGCSLNSYSDTSYSFVLLFMPVLFFLCCKLRIRHPCESRDLMKFPLTTCGNDFQYFLILFLTFFSILFIPQISYAKKNAPLLGTLELKSGFWLPSDNGLDTFYDPCCNQITKIQGALLFQKRYGIEGGVGFHYKSGNALGVSTGTASQDRFKLFLIPIETSFIWRMDYASWRWIVPYVRVGSDYVYFRETTSGTSIQGIKYGAHGGSGMSILLSELSDGNMRGDLGIEDLFLTLEGQYQWINNFGKKAGLDLSGFVYSIGLLFEF
ncbi:MAG: hypothetical protein A3I05_07655, partial [Deltaproteobacteria bacterium RIFCSPLOWO2_02_FULL_44_10]